MRKVFGGTASHKRSLVSGVSVIALAAVLSFAAPSGAMAANDDCVNALNANVINPISGGGASGQNNGTGSSFAGFAVTCTGNTVSGTNSLNNNANATVGATVGNSVFGNNSASNNGFGLIGNDIFGNGSGNGNGAGFAGNAIVGNGSGNGNGSVRVSR